MALDFNTTSDQVSIAAAASINTLSACSRILWIWFDSFINNANIIRKSTGAARKIFVIAGTTSIKCEQGRPAGGNQTATAVITNMPTLATGKWVCLACVYDMAVGTTATKLYSGDGVTLLAEPSSYSAQTGAADSPGDDSADPYLVSGLGVNLDAKIGPVAVFNRVLSLAELQSWQFRPRMMDGCVGYWHLGFNGTGSQIDYSGNGNHGTVTGATVTAHPPQSAPFGRRRYANETVTVAPTAAQTAPAAEQMAASGGMSGRRYV